MANDYYNKVINLYKEIVDVDRVSVADILKAVNSGENNAGIKKDWLHAVYNQTITDPGIKRIDALYRVLRKLKQKINRKK